MSFKEATEFETQTRSAFLWTRILNIPFWVVYNILYIILFKELGATPLQITAIIALKPAASLLSPYWSISVVQRSDKLVSNLVWANILKFLPFIFFPWITNNWILILAFGYYMVFVRGVVPAWMEIIKQNIQGVEREKVFAFGSAIDYLGSALLPLAFGWVLDAYPGIWRWIFCYSALIGIFSTFFLYRIRVNISPQPVIPQKNRQKLSEPWVAAWRLLSERRDFAKFQIGYLLGGSALMMIHTVQSMYFVDVLNLSYTEMLLALGLCKGLAFAATSPTWVKWFNSVNIFKACAMVTFLGALFPLTLLLAGWETGWVYAAFLVYGIMQAGSELTWHMSGPVFSKNEDSAVYSTTNVLIVGLRGCVAPALGSLIFYLTNSMTVLCLSSLLCLVATERMLKYSYEEEKETLPETT
ncbi:MAG: MFS transporter [Parachlamydiales bacterium]|jgi:MFS family permease